MSTADYVAKYNRRRALLTQVENYWIDEAYRELSHSSKLTEQDLPDSSTRRSRSIRPY